MTQTAARKFLLLTAFGLVLGCATAQPTQRRNTLADARPEEHKNDPTTGTIGVTGTQDGVAATRVGAEEEKTTEDAPVLQTGTRP